jgi:signal transduction histidine kinase/CheY-like chemotaxis protein
MRQGDGSYRRLAWTFTASDASFHGLGRPVVSARAVAEAFRGNGEQIRRLFEQAPGFVVVLGGPDHVFEFVNEAYEQLVGRRPLVGRPAAEALPELVEQGLLDLIDDVYRTGRPFLGQRMPLWLQRIPGAPRERRYVDFVWQPILDAGGRTAGIFAQGHDVTDQVQAERALQQSEARFRDYAEIASDWLWETDADLRITRFEGAEDGRRLDLKEQKLGKTRWEAADADLDDPLWALHVETMRRHLPFRNFQYSLVDAAGRKRYLSSSGRPLFDPDGAFLGYRGVSTDLTDQRQAESERQQLEARFQQAQKMEAVGQLTGGIAHDFNNLLTVILGNAEVLAEESTASHLKALAEMIGEAASRGAELTQHLLAFGRRQSLKAERLQLDRVVSRMVPLLRRTLGEHIEIRTDLAPGPQSALTDRALLESAILNLTVNAGDAMPRGGVLTLATGARTAGVGEQPLPIGQPVVFVSVTDTGTGITPDVLERVFEPFFTTKEVGKGSGLGLSMVYGFAQQSGGHVSIRSTPGEGTSVTILLPAIGNAVQPASEVGKAGDLRKGHERVLLVEDEPSVRLFVSSQLANLGYEVTDVGSGPEALALLQDNREFDLLFTDVVLPHGMSGVELARHARAIRPELKVLLTSGYPEEVFEQHGRPDPQTPLLRKPSRRKDLAEAVRKALDGPA